MRYVFYVIILFCSHLGIGQNLTTMDSSITNKTYFIKGINIKKVDKICIDGLMIEKSKIEKLNLQSEYLTKAKILNKKQIKLKYKNIDTSFVSDKILFIQSQYYYCFKSSMISSRDISNYSNSGTKCFINETVSRDTLHKANKVKFYYFICQ